MYKEPINQCESTVQEGKATINSNSLWDLPSRLQKCKFCSSQFETVNEYLSHIEKVHRKNKTTNFMCSVCGKQYKTKHELNLHNRSKCGTIKQFNCKICNQDLMSAGSLYNHMLRHNGVRSFMCRFCAKLFFTAGQLKVHERIHTQDKAYICEVCNKGFCHRQSLITHSTMHTGIKPYLCENCGNSFSCVGNLIKHRKTHADTCGLTPLTTHRVKNPSTKIKIRINTPSNSKLKPREKEVQKEVDILKTELRKSPDHIKEEEEDQHGSLQHHSADEYMKNDNAVKIEEVVFNNYKENKNVLKIEGVNCNKLSQDGEEINSSKSLKNSEEENCSKTVKNINCSKYNLDYIESDDENNFDDFVDNAEVPDSDDGCTEKQKDRTYKINTSVKKKYTRDQDKEEIQRFAQETNFDKEGYGDCTYCGKRYMNVRWLYKHVKCHQNSYTQKCNYCEMTFPEKKELLAHQRINHTDVLTCYDCDKVFANRDSLRAHQKVFHQGIARKEYIYMCEKCGKRFRQKAYLKDHEKRLCERGPCYECEICKKQFTSIYTRNNHMRVHDSEKKLLCKFCAKSFHWKGQLKIHERSHTGEKPFACLYCPKAFAYRESLITHSSMHTGIKPHLCEGCGARFSCIGNLIKHRSSHASECGSWAYKSQKQSQDVAK